MKLDLEKYEAHLAEEKLELAVPRKLVGLGKRLIKWDPRKHPRDPMGRFRRVFNTIDVGETIEVPSASLDVRDNTVRGFDDPTGEKAPRVFITKTNDGAAVWRSDNVPESLDDLDSRPEDEAIDELMTELMYDESMEDVIIGDSNTDPLMREELAAEYNERVRQGVPTIRMPLLALFGFLKDGRYKNQHESGASMGFFSPDGRREVELRLWPDIDESPVYGYLGEEDPSPDELVDTPQYGPFRLILKDEVKERSTTTLGDSLNHERIPIANGEADEFTMALVFDAMDEIIGDRSGETGKAWGSPSQVLLELQIFGGVNLDDVEEIVIDGQFLRWLESDRPLPWGPTEEEKEAFSWIEEFLEERGIELRDEWLPGEFEFEEWLYDQREGFAEDWAEENDVDLEEVRDDFRRWED